MTTTTTRNRLPKVEPKCKGDTWYLQFNWKGEQKYLSFGTGKTGKTTATAKAHQILGDLQTGNFDPTLDKYRDSSRVEVSKPTISPTIELFKELADLKLKEFGYSGTKTYRAVLTFFKNKHFPVNALELKAALLESDLSVKTKKNYAMCFSAFSKYLKDKYNLIVDYSLSFKIAEKPKPKPFSKDEILSIIEWFKNNKPIYHWFVKFRFLTGMRTGEIVGLRWSDIHPDGIYLFSSITHCSEHGRLERKGTKTGKGRIIPVNNEILQCLKEHKEYLESINKLHPELIFINRDNRPIDSGDWSLKWWRKALSELNIPIEDENGLRRTPYTSRHSFISHGLKQGIDPVLLAEIAGHDPQTLFKHYTGLISQKVMPNIL